LTKGTLKLQGPGPCKRAGAGFMSR
jgi:hypothetical protein